MTSGAGIDGRRQRSQRSRERLLDAVESALRERDLVLTPEHVAARAGVSLSTLFRQFGDLEGLDAAMRERVSQRVRPLLADATFSGNLAERARELVRRRIAVFETIAPFRRTVIRLPTRSAASRSAEEELEAALRLQLDAALGAELASPQHAETRTLVEALLSFEVWNRLGTTQRRAPRAVSALLERGVHALLASAARTSPASQPAEEMER